MSSLKPIGNIVVICCAFFIIFGILGVQLFKGKFFVCVGDDVKNITNKSSCLQANNKWIRHKYNFDNLGQALMSLFVLASKDGWVDIMYDGLDAVGVDQQPIMNYNPWMLLYFISFLLIVAFFVLNMFVGVVVENFHKCRRHQEAEEAKIREEKRLKRMEKKRRSKEKELAGRYWMLRKASVIGQFAELGQLTVGVSPLPSLLPYLVYRRRHLLVPGVSWALSEGTLKGTEFLACSVCPFKPTTTTDRDHPTMVAKVLSSVITGAPPHRLRFHPQSTAPLTAPPPHLKKTIV
ncbi:hypothetical protein FQN60_002664 [Etheostoma spectabile]|uniref:Ion transport domain-containing protein n=1 Tax=Etheostoma spectabile TaxID=54343 RepID=A0A5J5CK08_9PERO|nr:hypothetical protein FQN60_002664 [Etheostoma spectabile]